MQDKPKRSPRKEQGPILAKSVAGTNLFVLPIYSKATLTMNTPPTKRNRIADIVRLAVNSGLIASCVAVGSAAHAGITFQFDYGTNNGTGFWDATDGATRRAAMDTASSAFSNMFGSYFSNSATIILSATASTTLPATTWLQQVVLHLQTELPVSRSTKSSKPKH